MLGEIGANGTDILARNTSGGRGPGNVLDEEIVLTFVRSAIKSAWSLELLATAQFTHQPLAGLIELGEAGVRYRPQSGEQAALATALVELYGQKPLTVLKAIFASPSDKIRSFSDAFLFQKK